MATFIIYMSKKKKVKLKIKPKKPWEVSKGPWSPRSGAGPMKDKRLKRKKKDIDLND